MKQSRDTNFRVTDFLKYIFRLTSAGQVTTDSFENIFFFQLYNFCISGKKGMMY